jgi:hypothetical protein
MADKIAEEIALVMKSRIEEVVKGYSLELEQRELMEKQMKAIKNRTYLWIHLIFDGLMKSKTQFTLTKKDIMDLMTTLPQGADDAYERILKKSPSPEKARRILYVILGAKRPLSLAEMSVTLAFGDSNDQASGTSIADMIAPADKLKIHLRNICGLFVTVVDNKVYLLHQTAREFLLQNSTHNTAEHLAALDHASHSGPMKDNCESYDWKHSMNPTDSDTVLAETCISYLQSDIAKENRSMFEYSAIYWPAHYRQSVKTCQVEMAKMTQDICLPSESRTQWTEIHRRYNSIPTTGSPLCLASALGLDNTVEKFLYQQNSTSLDLKDKVNSKDRDDRTPLWWAAKNGYEAVVKLLLESKAEVDSKDSKFGRTPLLLAAKNGHEAVVKLLLESKAEVDSKDRLGRTPLSWAAENGHEAVVKLLSSREGR